MPSIVQASASGGTTAFRSWNQNEAQTRGEFRAAAIWITSSPDTSSDAADIAGDSDPQLDEILAAIASDVQAKAAGLRSAIMAEFGGKVAYARKHLPRDQAAGAIRAFRDAQAAALALIAKEAASELAARREAAIRSRSKRSRVRNPSIGGGPSGRPTPK